MTPEQIIYGNIRYTYSPLLLVPLETSFLIGEGFNPFPLIQKATEEELVQVIRQLSSDQEARHKALAARNKPMMLEQEPKSKFGLTLKGL